MSFGLDCQEVILWRFARLARGDLQAMREANKMVVEKATIASSAMLNAFYAWPTGGEPAASAAVARTYQSAVRANRRRLRSKS
jgi:hypothetical protein